MSTTTAPQATPPVVQMGPRLRFLTELDFEGHVRMVHNALGAVHSLALPRWGNGLSESGVPDDMHLLKQNDLVDLLEIINDRLATALEVEEFRRAN